jgi:hypothetical protein
MRKLLIASTLALCTASPALAWEFEESTEGGTLVSAWQDSDDGYQLAIECDDVFTDPDLYVFTPERWDDTTSYADSVPLMVAVDGVPTGPLNAAFQNIDGEVAVSVYAEDDDRLWPLHEAMRHAASSIEISFFDKSVQFDVQAVDESIGQALDRCDELAGY